MADTSGRALYLAWRPRRFDDVVGQRHVVRTIQNAVKNGTLAHAYLFSGPRGTGKTSMARLLFKAVNCLQPRDGAPCETCALCTSANEGRALDLIELDAASNRGIDDVRDLRDKINYAPADARYRVYILDEAHQLTQAAWDALLKTLEEPPPHAILVLATTEAHKVPATVLSRCQRFDFHRHSAADIRERLAMIAASEGVVVEPTVLSWLARAARGGMRDAISLLDQLRAFCGEHVDAASARDVLGLAGLETVRPFLEALQDDRPGDALEELNGALERGTDLRTFVGDGLTYLRALLLLRYGAVASLRQELPIEELEWLEERATEWPAGRLRSLVGGFGDALARFRDPAQLLVQVELTLLGGWDAPDEGSAPRASARPSTHEAPAAYTAGFVPARAARQAAMAPSESRGPELAASAPPASIADAPPTAGTRPAPDVLPSSSAQASTAASTLPVAPPPALTPDATSSALASEERTTVLLPAEPPGPRAPGPRVTESAASRAVENPTAIADDGDGGRPLWDDDDGPGAWPAGLVVPPAAAPPAPRDDPDDRTRASSSPAFGDAATRGDAASNGASRPVVPLVPATSGRGAGTSATAAATTEKPVGGAPPPTPTPQTTDGGSSEAPAGPALDFAELRREWPSLRDTLTSGRLDRMAILSNAELVDTVGSTLVVKVGSGHLKLLDDDQKRRELRGELIRALGYQADLRFVDEYVRPERPAAPSLSGAASHALPPAADPNALAAADPVIQCGLRLFGGPLVRVDGDDTPSPASLPATSASTDEDASDDADDGAIIGRGGMPVRDWYNY